MRHRPFVSIALLSCAVVATGEPPPSRYHATSLGRLGQFCVGGPRLADRGLVVATFMMGFENVGGVLEPVYLGAAWTDGRWQPLPNLPGGRWTQANAVNRAGLIVGTAGLGAPGGPGHAAILGNGRQITISLGTFGGVNSRALAVNSSGVIVGGGQTTSGSWRAFRWSPDAPALLDLGTLGGDGACAFAINDAGLIVGYAHGSDGGDRAFLFANDVMVDLNCLRQDETTETLLRAVDINEAGRIVGTASCGADFRGFEAGGGLPCVRLLPPLAGFPSSSALAVDERGRVVGYSLKWPEGGMGEFSLQPTLWIDGQPLDLQILVTHGPVSMATATDITRFGHIGLATQAGDVRVLRPAPEPAPPPMPTDLP